MKRREFFGVAAALSLLATSEFLNANEQERISKMANKLANLTPKAKEAYESLYGGIFPLEVSDPEFSEIYLNFLFDDVAGEINLSKSERSMISLACLIGAGSTNAYERAVGIALKNGVTPEAIKEILYQSVAYVGFARAERCFYACDRAFKENGVKLPLKDRKTVTQENRQAKGLEVQKAYFPNIEKNNASAPADQQHIRKFLSANCFGDYYTRGGLDLKTRELMTFVYIASLGFAQPQLKGHVAGNLTAGNDRAKLIDTVTAMIAFIGYPRSLNALSAIDEITKK